jgi:hypothetical protein
LRRRGPQQQNQTLSHSSEEAPLTQSAAALLTAVAASAPDNSHLLWAASPLPGVCPLPSNVSYTHKTPNTSNARPSNAQQPSCLTPRLQVPATCRSTGTAPSAWQYLIPPMTLLFTTKHSSKSTAPTSRLCPASTPATAVATAAAGSMTTGAAKAPMLLPMVAIVS